VDIVAQNKGAGMKRDSHIYIGYLEALVLSLLEERQSDELIHGKDFTGQPVTYSPYNAKALIAKCKEEGFANSCPFWHYLDPASHHCFLCDSTK
jgi:hypothetical protein